MVAATLTPYMNESPAPRVEVYFSSFAAGTATVTVFRLTQESWESIYPLLEPSAQDEVSGIAYKLHVLDPYLKLVVLGKAASGARSGLPASRESHRADSKGGSPRKSRATTTQKDVSPEPQ